MTAQSIHRTALGACVTFAIFTGGTRAEDFRSKVMKGGMEPAKISVGVEGMQKLLLVATGYSWGQAVWGEAELVAADGARTKIADLKPNSVAVGWGQFTVNAGPDGKPLQIGTRQMSHGIFAHADSRVIYDLDGNYQRLEAWVGVNHTASNRGSVVFEVVDAAAAELRSRIQTALQSFSPERFAQIREQLSKLAATKPEAAELLKLAASLEESQDEIRQGLERGSEEALAKAESISDLMAKLYRSQLDAPLLFVKRHPYYAGHIYDDYFAWHPGGGIYVIENPADPMPEHTVRAVIDPTTPETLGEGVYRDPEISWDGTRVVFAFKGEPSGDTSIYEIGIDGKGLRRLTNPGRDRGGRPSPQGLVGSGQHDISPAYLPDGRIVFTSTRSGGQVMCFSSYIDTLHTMNLDGSDLRCISVNNQNEFDPSVLPDGRILYGRWEYVDKTALYMQSLWAVNPDGSSETALFANNLAKPTALLDARPVPGTDLIVGSLTPHNGQAVGAIAMIDPKVGKNSLEAITNFTPEHQTEMDQGLRRGPCDPWALSEDVVLIANNDPRHGEHGVIELVSRSGLRTVLHREAGISCYSPMLVKRQAKPQLRPSMIRPGEPGRFMVHDIYRGMDGVERGAVKTLRVVETTSRVSGIPAGGRWWNQAFLASWQGSYDIKRFLGVVPVEADGSAYFEAPVGKALYFQALDKDGRMVQSQRTFVQAVSGITRSCQGCHVKEEDAAPVNSVVSPLAARRPAARLRPESWGSGFVDYPKQVQPVLDQHCVSCHGGDEGIAGGIDLSGGWTWAFNISYETLLKNTLTGFLNCNNGSVHTAEILLPRAHGSGSAPLAELLVSGHGDRLDEMSRKDIDLLLAWIDGNCNYYGTWDYSEHAVCDAGLGIRAGLLEQMKAGGCLECHQKEIGNDWINLRTPERSRILRAPLAATGDKLGLAWCRDRKARGLDYPLVTGQHQPPDIARPKTRSAPDPGGEIITTFSDTGAPVYRAMLALIEQARVEALKTPRIDMPGAIITRGQCRELTPIAPPKYPEIP